MKTMSECICKNPADLKDKQKESCGSQEKECCGNTKGHSCKNTKKKP